MSAEQTTEAPQTAKDTARAEGGIARAAGTFGTIMRLQHLAGNRATSLMLQTKSTVGPANDKYEREADRVASKVMRQIQRHPPSTVDKADAAELRNREAKRGELLPAGGSTSRQVNRVVTPTAGHTSLADLPVQRSTRDAVHVALETHAPTVMRRVRGPDDLTPQQCTEHAENLEREFGIHAAKHPAALAGAQALVDNAMKLITVHVTLWNKNLEAAKATGDRLTEELKSVEKLAKEGMGTRAGIPSRAIAGAVGPNVILNHLKEDGGNLRTKMTAVFNFMRPMNAIVLDENKKSNKAFFAELGDSGQVLLQAAAATEARLAADPSATLTSDARSEVASQQKTDRLARPGGGDARGTDADPFRSKRKADDPSIGIALDADEQAFMGFTPERLAEETLRWQEGLALYTMKEENKWVARQRELLLPIGAGPASGTTDRLMQTGEQLGCDSVATRAATIGYLLPIRAHSLVEIMTSAAAFAGCTESLDGFRMYRSIAPFGSLKPLDKSNDPRFWNDEVARADEPDPTSDTGDADSSE